MPIEEQWQDFLSALLRQLIAMETDLREKSLAITLQPLYSEAELQGFNTVQLLELYKVHSSNFMALASAALLTVYQQGLVMAELKRRAKEDGVWILECSLRGINVTTANRQIAVAKVRE